MKLLPLLILIFSFSTHAERLISRIHSIERSPDERPHLVRFENGRVGFVSSEDKATLSTLSETKRDWLDVELDSKGNFLGASVVPAPKAFSESSSGTVGKENYIPTNLESMDDATAIFKRMNRNTQWESQCYNRAHVWTYEEYKRSGLQSMKLFMFFTRSYIWKYRYQWWFHVTPMSYVDGTPVTLDRTFMRAPVGLKTWTDNFIYSKRTCPIIHKYSEYRDHQDAEHCYLHPATMYFWQPRDLENYENTGAEKTSYIRSEINWAYYEAF